MSWLAAILSVPVTTAPDETTRTLVALTAFVMVTVDAEDVSETSPPEEVRVAPVRLVNSPDPEIEILPAA
jgi:hypothetical protein